MLIISLICILILCVLIERMTHVVISPVKKMTKVITAMAGGDFTVSMKVKEKMRSRLWDEASNSSLSP